MGLSRRFFSLVLLLSSLVPLAYPPLPASAAGRALRRDTMDTPGGTGWVVAGASEANHFAVGPDGVIYLHMSAVPFAIAQNLATDILTYEEFTGNFFNDPGYCDITGEHAVQRLFKMVDLYIR